jgi:membrane associated rhomboid family serine protease
MIIPIRTDSPLRSTPWMNWVLIAANVIAFLFQWFTWRESPPGAIDPRDPRLLNYFTYQFLHGDGWHIATNMLFLYAFGNNVNDRMGNLGYLAFYLGGGVFAGIGHVMTSSGPAIGASGAVAAVTGAYLVLLPRSHITIFYFFFILFGTFELPCIYFIIASFLMDFISGFSSQGSNIAHTAHLAGSVFGFAVSFGLLTVKLLPRDQFDLFALYQRWNRRRQYQDMVRKGYDPFRAGSAGTRGAPNPQMDRIQDLRGKIGDLLAEHKVEDAARSYLELHAIDPEQVLARQNQLDVANQLFAQGTHGAAADAYEGFLRFYPKYDQVEQVQLMLGLLYARYLNRPDKAREHLSTSLNRLSDSRQQELARDELTKLGGAVQGT